MASQGASREARLGGRRCHGHSWTAVCAHRRCVSARESPGERLCHPDAGRGSVLIRRSSRRPNSAALENCPFTSRQAAVDQFRALLAALRDPQPWPPGQSQDLAVRVSPFVERAHPRPGDDHGPDIIAVTLLHPGGGGRPCGDAHVCFRVPRTASAVVQQHRAFDAAVSRACRRTAHLSGTHVVPPTTHAGRHGLEARVAAGDCVVGDRWGPRW